MLKDIWKWIKETAQKIIVPVTVVVALVTLLLKQFPELFNKKKKRVEEAKEDVKDSKEEKEKAEKDLDDAVESSEDTRKSIKKRRKEREKTASKYGVAFALFLMLPLAADAQESFDIDTHYGEETITVPEGTSTEEALQDFARLYLEERHDYDLLEEEHEQVLERLEDYRERVDRLINNYDSLVEELERKEPFQRNALLGVNYQPSTSGIDIQAGLGLTLYENYDITPFVSAGQNFSFGLQLGVRW